MRTTDYWCMAGAVAVWAVVLWFGWGGKLILATAVAFVVTVVIKTAIYFRT